MPQYMNNTQSHYVINYGKRVIEYSLLFKKRKRLLITVDNDMSVSVIAPLGQKLAEVQKQIQKKASWIVKQQKYYEQFLPRQPERQYVSGETHYYLGRQYRLRIIRSKAETVKLKGKFFIVKSMRRENPEYIMGLVDAWYQAHARKIVEQKAAEYLENLPELKMAPPRIVIKRMKKRWGSCSTNGTIHINLDIFRVPMSCIEYVIIHELCHLKIHNHGSQFYKLLTSCMPDWQERKARLDAFAIL